MQNLRKWRAVDICVSVTLKYIIAKNFFPHGKNNCIENCFCLSICRRFSSLYINMLLMIKSQMLKLKSQREREGEGGRERMCVRVSVCFAYKRARDMG